MNNGYIFLHRSLINNCYWGAEKFTRGQAWVDMLMLANFKESSFYKRGVLVNVPRGALARSEVELADRWQWSRQKVRGFLKSLENEQQIEQQKTNVTTLIRIVNYEKYQTIETADETESDTASHTAEKHQKDTKKTHIKKNNKNNKNNNNPPIVPPWVDQTLWAEFLAMRKTLKAVNSDLALKAIVNKLENFYSEGKDPNAIIEQSIVSSWKDVYDLKNNRQFSGAPQQNKQAALEERNRQAALAWLSQCDEKTVEGEVVHDDR